ncbi:uncharacterized protein LOC144706700 [Wolffia australiana]
MVFRVWNFDLGFFGMEDPLGFLFRSPIGGRAGENKKTAKLRPPIPVLFDGFQNPGRIHRELRSGADDSPERRGNRSMFFAKWWIGADPSEISISISSAESLRTIGGGVEALKKADLGGLLKNLRFSWVGGPPAMNVASSVQEFAAGLLRFRIGDSWAEVLKDLPRLMRSSSEHPDKDRLIAVQDFFKYTEFEGRRFFEELDRDGDGQVTLEDLEIAMRKRRLPQSYAREFLRQTRCHIFAKSIKWKQFLSLMEQKEATILRAYTNLCLTKSGTLEKSQLLATLKNAHLPANEDSATAMMRFLNADVHGSVSYAHFRNFMILLPSERLEDDPRSVWFEAATVVSAPPPFAMPVESSVKLALAGGIASLLYTLDAMKVITRPSLFAFK